MNYEIIWEQWIPLVTVAVILWRTQSTSVRRLREDMPAKFSDVDKRLDLVHARLDRIGEEFREGKKERKDMHDKIIELSQSVKYVNDRLDRVETRQGDLLGSVHRTEGYLEWKRRESDSPKRKLQNVS